jgi:hypothetical protein
MPSVAVDEVPAVAFNPERDAERAADLGLGVAMKAFVYITKRLMQFFNISSRTGKG